MVEIFIQQKRSNTWMWVIGLAVLALLTRGAVDLLDGNEQVELAAPDAAAPVAAAPGVDQTPMTDIVAIVAVPDRLPLVGRRVQLTGAPVQSVPGDESFWLGANDAQRLFVAVDAAPGTAALEESRADVNVGQTVTVTGVLRPVPADIEPLQTRWKLDAATVTALRTAQVYLAANQVTVTGR